MSKRLHPKTYAKALKAYEADPLAQRIAGVIDAASPENEGRAGQAYEWPMSEALIVARWLRNTGMVPSE